MEIKFYKAGIACRSLTAKVPVTGSGASANVAVIPFKSIDGSLCSQLLFNTSSGSYYYAVFRNLFIFDIQNVYASTDSTFDIDEYSAKNVVGTISRSIATGVTGRTFRISVYNNTANPITVNSFKFEKNDISFAPTNQTGIKTLTALVFWVKLDSAATIAAGETKDFVIDINFLNE